MSESPSYQIAVTKTEKYDQPAVGFTKAPETGAVVTYCKLIIRQNNTIIQLLTQLADSISGLNFEVKTARAQEDKTSQIPEDIIAKLQNLTLGPADKPKEAKKGKLFAFQDPYFILQQEKEKPAPHAP